MLTQTINLIASFIFLLFLPGFLISLLFFSQKEINIFERICISIVLSIAIAINLGIILWFSKLFFNILGLNRFNLYSGLIFITLSFLIILFLRKFKKLSHK